MKKTDRKKPKEKDIKNLEWLSVVTAVMLSVICVIYSAGILQEIWVLNLVLILGVLMHTLLALLGVVHRRYLVTWTSLLLALACAGFLIYFA